MSELIGIQIKNADERASGDCDPAATDWPVDPPFPLFLSGVAVFLRPKKVVLSPLGRGQMTQVSVINALMTGRYEGAMPIPELLRYGDFGVGTLDHLDGELICPRRPRVSGPWRRRGRSSGT